MTEPAVSVVVPTRNRAHLLPRLSSALATQEGVESFEVIVVDDCSTDDTRAVLEGIAGGGGLTVRALRTERPGGAAAARNLGWRAARAPLVVFTDDDCVPQPGWLAAMVADLREADIVQGRTAYDTVANPSTGPFVSFVSVPEWSWQFETCNIGYRSDLLHRLGGFDEGYESDSFGEDIDLGWRAIEQGATYAFAAEACVLHDVKRSTHTRNAVASLRRGWRWRHIGRVVRDHPGYARHRLHHGVFLRRTHLPMLAALAGLAVGTAARRRPWGALVAAAGLVPWVAVRSTIEALPPVRRRNLPAAFALAFLVDATEVIVTVGSSVRYRGRVL